MMGTFSAASPEGQMTSRSQYQRVVGTQSACAHETLSLAEDANPCQSKHSFVAKASERERDSARTPSVSFILSLPSPTSPWAEQMP